MESKGLRTFREVSRGIELDTEMFGIVDIYNDAYLNSIDFELSKKWLRVEFSLIKQGKQCLLTFQNIRNLIIESDRYLFTDLANIQFESLTYGAKFFSTDPVNIELDTNAMTIRMYAEEVSFELID